MSAEYPYSQHSISFHRVYTNTKSEYGAHRPVYLDRVGMSRLHDALIPGAEGSGATIW